MNANEIVAVYLRVSTVDQNTEAQEHQVLEFCRKRGWRSPRVFRDLVCGAANHRPRLDSMLQFIRAGRVRYVVTYKLDRLGRSLTQLAIMVSEFQTRNVGLICTSQGIDTSTPNPAAQLQLGVLMAVAEFERALIKERTIAGLAVARMHGKRIGRPPISSRKVRHILKIARRLGRSIRSIAREAAVAPSTVARVLARSRQRSNK